MTMTGVSSRVLLFLALVATGVGLLDSAFSSEWDLFGVFVLLLLLQLSLWVRQRGNRRPVTLRPDLERWLEERSQRVGEPFDDMIDRAVAHYKHGLYVEANGDP